ncbi:tetratricopeptide repeat protein [Neolewinella antarctica]|uniref:Tetratricopeptide (TPR) repeat protein n=1 Tax=Neolewinella antarctica TaxID=442734 RepID=A0ABX0X6N8_9BACT|nr:tetratricopeptide repeat protein [Neolewinella antarctica]NJC24886.1 tetratricopeptide (TPR) repeat protein [Neolewinella antarctica]
MNKIYTPLLSLLLLIGLCTCDSAEKDKDASVGINDVEVPELLPRPEALQNAMEWDRTQSGYMQMASDLRLKDSKAVEPRIKLAQIFTNEARVTGEHGHYYPAALKMVNEALGYNQGKDTNLEFLGLSTKASVQLSQHDFTAALATAKQAIAINPYNAQIYGALVDANVELGNYEAAVTAADQMVKIRPDLRSYSRVSYLREIHGDVDGSQEAMMSAVKAGAPGYESTAWARLTLGELYQRYGEPKKAKQQFEMILRERPNYPFAMAALGQLEMDAENYAEAEKLVQEAADIIPEVGYYVQLAEIFKKTGQTDKQEQIEKEIFVMLQDDVDSGHNMDLEYASFYRDHFGDYDKALEYAEREYEKRPENIDVNRMMASLYDHKGMKDEARPYLLKAGATESKHPEFLALSSKK